MHKVRTLHRLLGTALVAVLVLSPGIRVAAKEGDPDFVADGESAVAVCYAHIAGTPLRVDLTKSGFSIIRTRTELVYLKERPGIGILPWLQLSLSQNRRKPTRRGCVLWANLITKPEARVTIETFRKEFTSQGYKLDTQRIGIGGTNEFLTAPDGTRLLMETHIDLLGRGLSVSILPTRSVPRPDLSQN